MITYITGLGTYWNRLVFSKLIRTKNIDFGIIIICKYHHRWFSFKFIQKLTKLIISMLKSLTISKTDYLLLLVFNKKKI